MMKTLQITINYHENHKLSDSAVNRTMSYWNQLYSVYPYVKKLRERTCWKNNTSYTEEQLVRDEKMKARYILLKEANS